MYLLLLTFTKTTVMRLKSLLLLIFLTQIFCAAVFGQSSTEKTVATKVEKKDSIQAKASRGIAPAFAASDITPLTGREDNPVLLDKMDSRKSIFYSNAQMYVAQNTKDDSSKDASIFIQGTAKFDNAAEILQIGESALTGDFVSLKDDANKTDLGDVKPLFVVNADTKDGLIKFVGKKNKQYIVREDLTGKRLPNQKKVGETTGLEYVMDFPQLKVEKDGLSTVQAIKGEAGYDVEKMGFVSVSSNVAMSVGKLDMTGGNRFSIDVVSEGLEKDALAQAATKADYYKLNSAFVDIKTLVDGNGVDNGHSEVNLKMYDATNATSIEKTNTIAVSGGTDGRATFLRGFGSPFSNLKADYMFYHVLTRPSATSITSSQGPIADPRTDIERGYGHFMAMDVSREYFDQIQKKWHSSNANAPELRAKGGYNLSRVVQRMKDESGLGARLSLYTFDQVDANNDTDPELTKRAYEEQRFNVGNVSVFITGATGGVITYLANPFMTPINISGLLAKYDGTAYETDILDDDTKLTTEYRPRFFADNIRAVHVIKGPKGEQLLKDAENKWLILRPKYWVPHSGLIANTKIGGLPAYAYNVKYDNVSAVMEGQSVPVGVFDRYIEPMQMFVVQASNEGYFTFTQDMKTFKGNPFVSDFSNAGLEVPQTPGARSFAATEADSYLPNDWIVVEATSDGKADRTAVRFYEGATQGVEREHDVIKQFSDPSPKAMKSRSIEEGIAADVIEKGDPSNAVYTTSAGSIKEKMLSNGVGYNTKQIPLHYVSSSKEPESVTFTFTGMSGFDQVRGVSLVDRFLYSNGTEYIQPLSEGDTYEFTTRVGKETVDGDNRFYLRFDDEDDNGPSVTDEPITCYYSGSILHIGGLNEKDLGSKVQIFDLQGRMMGNTVVNNYPSMEYPKPLGQGTFIVNISGERNYKTKFVNLQNY